MNNFAIDSHNNSGEQSMAFFKDDLSEDELKSIILEKDKLIDMQIKDIGFLKNEIKDLKNELGCCLDKEK